MAACCAHADRLERGGLTLTQATVQTPAQSSRRDEWKDPTLNHLQAGFIQQQRLQTLGIPLPLQPRGFRPRHG